MEQQLEEAIRASRLQYLQHMRDRLAADDAAGLAEVNEDVVAARGPVPVALSSTAFLDCTTPLVATSVSWVRRLWYFGTPCRSDRSCLASAVMCVHVDLQPVIVRAPPAFWWS